MENQFLEYQMDSILILGNKFVDFVETVGGLPCRNQTLVFSVCFRY